MKSRRFIVLFFFPLFLSLFACTHSHRHLITPTYQATNYSTHSHAHQANSIQIITTRSPLFYSHAAVRLRYKSETLFWDPAGAYGLEYEWPAHYEDYPLPEGFSRSEDLITRGSPDLHLYWQYSIFTGDNGMEVFEWILNEQQAKFYYELLLDGASNGGKKVDFITKAHMKICSSAVSSFVQRFGGDIIPLQSHYTFPHGLAHELHKLDPDYIYYFEDQQPATVFKP